MQDIKGLIHGYYFILQIVKTMSGRARNITHSSSFNKSQSAAAAPPPIPLKANPLQLAEIANIYRQSSVNGRDEECRFNQISIPINNIKMSKIYYILANNNHCTVLQTRI